MDGLRLLFGRHLHPRARPRPPASRCRARDTGRSSSAAITARIEGAFILFSPESRLLLHVPLVRRPRRQRRLQHPPGPLPPSGRSVLRRGGQRAHERRGRAGHAVRRCLDRAVRREADGELAIPSRRRRASGRPPRAIVSPGHNSAYYDRSTRQHFLVFHTRFAGRGEDAPGARASALHERGRDGWWRRRIVSPARASTVRARECRCRATTS